MTAHPRPLRHQRHAASRSRARRDQPAPGDCPLRDRGTDGGCSGPERLSIADGCGTYRRGCIDHAAQALIRHPLGYLSSATPTDRTRLEERMRRAGTWQPRMHGCGMRGHR